MKKINIYKESGFSEKAFKKLLVHDSPYFKILNSVSLFLRVGESFWVKMRLPCLLNQVMS
jgi:hypothetical protein